MPGIYRWIDRCIHIFFGAKSLDSWVHIQSQRLEQVDPIYVSSFCSWILGNYSRTALDFHKHGFRLTILTSCYSWQLEIWTKPLETFASFWDINSANCLRIGKNHLNDQFLILASFSQSSKCFWAITNLSYEAWASTIFLPGDHLISALWRGVRASVQEETISWRNMEFSYGGTPKSSILMGFSLINHPAIGIPTWATWLWKPHLMDKWFQV